MPPGVPPRPEEPEESDAAHAALHLHEHEEEDEVHEDDFDGFDGFDDEEPDMPDQEQRCGIFAPHATINISQQFGRTAASKSAMERRIENSRWGAIRRAAQMRKYEGRSPLTIAEREEIGRRAKAAYIQRHGINQTQISQAKTRHREERRGIF